MRALPCGSSRPELPRIRIHQIVCRRTISSFGWRHPNRHTRHTLHTLHILAPLDALLWTETHIDSHISHLHTHAHTHSHWKTSVPAQLVDSGTTHHRPPTPTNIHGASHLQRSMHVHVLLPACLNHSARQPAVILACIH